MKATGALIVIAALLMAIAGTASAAHPMIAAAGPAGTAVGNAVAGAAAGSGIAAAAKGSPDKAISIAGGNISVVQTSEYYIPAGDLVDDDVYLWAQMLDIDGTLDGDIFAWVQTADVSGVVVQDINMFAQDIVISGDVKDDVRVACQNLTVDGVISGDLIGAGADISVREGALVEGDLLVASGVVTVDGEVLGDARIGTGVFTLTGHIAGDVNVTTDGGITMGETAKIGGDLTYEGPMEIDFRPGSVAGTVTFKPPEKDEKCGDWEIPGAFKLALWIIEFIAAIVTGSILVALTKDHARRTAETIRVKPFKSLGIGFIAFICAPIVALITLVLIVTAPVAMLITFGYLICVYIAKFYVAIWLGNLILRRHNKPDVSPIPAMLLGLVIVYLVTAIPIVGTLIGIVIIFFGFGALLQRRETRLDRAFEPAPAAPDALPNGFPGSQTEA